MEHAKLQGVRTRKGIVPRFLYLQTTDEGKFNYIVGQIGNETITWGYTSGIARNKHKDYDLVFPLPKTIQHDTKNRFTTRANSLFRERRDFDSQSNKHKPRANY